MFDLVHYPKRSVKLSVCLVVGKGLIRGDCSHA